MGKIFKYEYVRVMKYVLHLLNFQCLPKRKKRRKKRKGRRVVREKRRADKFISALPFTVFSGILQFSPADLSKDISIGMFLSLCSNSHCSSSNTACSTQVGSWEDLAFNSLVMCALLNSNNSWIESNNAGFEISVLIQ